MWLRAHCTSRAFLVLLLLMEPLRCKLVLKDRLQKRAGFEVFFDLVDDIADWLHCGLSVRDLPKEVGDLVEVGYLAGPKPGSRGIAEGLGHTGRGFGAEFA